MFLHDILYLVKIIQSNLVCTPLSGPVKNDVIFKLNTVYNKFEMIKIGNQIREKPQVL